LKGNEEVGDGPKRKRKELEKNFRIFENKFGRIKNISYLCAPKNKQRGTLKEGQQKQTKNLKK
jgi:hypothetical protein